MKYAWIDAQEEFALTEMCAVLDVSVSGYRAWTMKNTIALLMTALATASAPHITLAATAEAKSPSYQVASQLKPVQAEHNSQCVYWH